MPLFIPYWNIVTSCGITVPQKAKKNLDARHVEAARIVTGGTKLCSVDKLYSELGWDSLQSGHYKHKRITLYKILHGFTPN